MRCWWQIVYSVWGSCVGLSPVLKQEIVVQVVKFAVKMFELPATGVDDDVDKAIENILTQVNNVLSALLHNNATATTFFNLFALLSPHLLLPTPLHRQRCLASLHHLLSVLHTHPHAEMVWAGVRQSGTDVGKVLSKLMPRCCDVVVGVRQTAMAVIGLLVTGMRMKGEDDGVSITSKVEELKHILESNDLNVHLGVVNDLATIVAQRVDSVVFHSLLISLVDGLTDSVDQSASGTCVIINGLIQNRGQEIQEDVPTLIGLLLTALKAIKFEMPMNGTVAIIRTIARYHFEQVVDVLLAVPLPLNNEVIKVVQKLSRDETLNTKLLQRLMSLMITENRATNTMSGDASTKTVHTPAMAATAVIGEILQIDEMSTQTDEMYSEILAAILLRIGAAATDRNASAQSGAVDTFRKFIERFHHEKDEEKTTEHPSLVKQMDENGSWQTLKSPDYSQMIPLFVSHFSRTHSDRMVAVFTTFLPYASTGNEGQRIMTCALFAELVMYCQDVQLQHKLVQSLIARMGDRCEAVRVMGLKGLGNLSVVLQKSGEFGSQTLSMLLSCLDDSVDSVCLQSLLSLKKVLPCLSDDVVAPALISICIKLRTVFERQNNDLRRESLGMFESISHFGKGRGAGMIAEQVQGNLISFVLHVNDENAGVRLQARRTLTALIPLLESEPLTTVVTGAVSTDENVVIYGTFDFESFADSIAAVLVEHFSEQLPLHFSAIQLFFSSPWSVIRANAAVLAGFLVSHAKKRRINHQNFDTVCAALTDMLRESSAIVRRSAAFALSSVHFD
eukprot:c8250_g1_i1.p1 GENE.c8250_g1_i1~~c8250_g1_i1.p1  ORF type:complete len:789 (+),score=215.45 c8250_g1_i1:995-3361(+)